MFTVKYRTYNLAKQQPVDGPRHYDEVELIYGPFEMVSKEHDEDGYPVVYAHRAGGAEGLTLKHCDHGDQVAGQLPPPRAMCWVMNEQGATIAKYGL
jgi:hypothetical protein